MLARFHRLSGDDIAARTAATTALHHASNPRQPLALIAAHRTLGELLTVGGQHDEAAQHLSASLELADACSALFERALTQVALAELHIAADRKGVARELLDEAHAVCDQLGARPTLNRIAALQATIQHYRAPAIYPAGLSRREVEVLRLVANGLPIFAVIAAVLVWSPGSRLVPAPFIQPPSNEGDIHAGPRRVTTFSGHRHRERLTGGLDAPTLGITIRATFP
jgi:hypothetical protein